MKLPWRRQASSREDATAPLAVAIAENEMPYVQLFEATAKQLGYDVIAYPTAQDLIDALATGCDGKFPSVFFLDIQMEDDEAGFRALEEVKRSPAFSRSVAIMISQSRRDTDVCASYEKGAALYVRKFRDRQENEKSLRSLLETLKKDEMRYCPPAPSSP